MQALFLHRQLLKTIPDQFQITKSRTSRNIRDKTVVGNLEIHKIDADQEIVEISYIPAARKILPLFLCLKNKGRVLFIFPSEAKCRRIFQGSRMVISSILCSNPRLLFFTILRFKLCFLRIFTQFFIKVFVKVGWEILCFLWHKTEICAVFHRVRP